MKRVLAFLLLIALGVLAMRLAIGDELAVGGDSPGNRQKASANPLSSSNNTEESGQADPQTPSSTPNAPSVRVQGGGVGATVGHKGALTFSEQRNVPIGNGRTRKDDVYILVAKDSGAVGDGLQQLIDVTLKLFDKGAHAATITASDAFIELGRNPNGDPSFDEQKKIDVRGAIITAEPGSQMEGLRLELGDAIIVLGDNEIQLTTEPDQSIAMTLAGKQTITLTGKGATARLPRNTNSGLRQAQVIIQTDPVLTTDDLTLTADGRMRYIEDTVSGAVQISLDDNVELEILNSTLKLSDAQDAKTVTGQAKSTSTAHGDQFTGSLLRNKSKVRQKRNPDDKLRSGSISWQRLVLIGAPATIDVPGIRVITPRIMVRPGPLGDPFIITTYGGESRVEQTHLFPNSKFRDLVTTSSPRRIHIARPSSSAGALHRGMGFPQWTLRPLEQQQIIIYEGAARFESGARTITASDGLVVYGRIDGATGIVQGFGEIEVLQAATAKSHEQDAQPALVAKSSDGVLLTVGKSFERIQLGPANDQSSVRSREHRYSIQYGAAALRGVGGCIVERTGNRTRLELRAPFDQIEADFHSEETQLRNVRQLLAAFDGEVLTDLDVGGLPVRATFKKQDEVIEARAPRLRQISQRSIRLLPMDLDESPWSEMNEIDRTPRLMRTWNASGEGEILRQQSVEVTGPRIDVHHAGGRHAIIDAHASGEDIPRIYAKVPQPGSSEPATVTCAARRLRVLPFAVTPEVRRVLFAGATGVVPDIITHSLSKPWLLVDDVRDFQLDDEKQGHITGSGKRLLISQGGKALLFIGDADAQTQTVVRRSFDGRTVMLEGARVRVSNDDAVRLSALGSFSNRSTFMPPTMTLLEPTSNGILANMRATCRGDIYVDPEAVRYGGPVEAQGIKADGQNDPDGINIDAKELIMTRLVKGGGPDLSSGNPGDIAMIKGKDVVIDWTQLDATAATIELDIQRGHCTASDPDGAIVKLPDGRTLRTAWAFVNYKTWSFRTGPSSVMQPKKVQTAITTQAVSSRAQSQEGQL